jgi:hypothetical protein
VAGVAVVVAGEVVVEVEVEVKVEVEMEVVVVVVLGCCYCSTAGGCGGGWDDAPKLAFTLAWTCWLPANGTRQAIYMCVWGMLCCAVRRAGGDGCARGVVRAVCGALGLIYKEFVIVFDSAPLGRL